MFNLSHCPKGEFLSSVAFLTRFVIILVWKNPWLSLKEMFEEIRLVASIGSVSKALGANGHLILVLFKGSFYEAGAWD